MDKRLVVFWEHLTMSAGVAKKAQCEGKKTYTITPRRSEFPTDKDPQEAIKEIYEEFGERPEAHPFKGIATAHGFAEIIGWKIIPVYHREPETTEHYEEVKLL